MTRVNARARKTKPSKKARSRRKLFWRKLRSEDKKKYRKIVAREDKVIKSLQVELEKVSYVGPSVSVGTQVEFCSSDEVWLRKMDRAEMDWQEKIEWSERGRVEELVKQEREWQYAWSLREKDLKKKLNDEKEEEKQRILEDRAKLRAENEELKRKIVELERQISLRPRR